VGGSVHVGAGWWDGVGMLMRGCGMREVVLSLSAWSPPAVLQMENTIHFPNVNFYFAALWVRVGWSRQLPATILDRLRG
jgi:hypothetical protein